MATEDRDLAQQADDTEGYGRWVRRTEPIGEEQGEGRVAKDTVIEEEDDTKGFRMKSPGEERMKAPGDERLKNIGDDLAGGEGRLK